MTGTGGDRPAAKETSAREHVEYVLPARRLAGTRAEVVDELDELILALTGVREMISRQQRENDPKRLKPRRRWGKALAIAFVLVAPAPGGGQTTSAADAPPQHEAQRAAWRYGGFADVGYLHGVNDPEIDLFRSRGTTWHLNAAHLNMAGAYVKKQASPASRWGTELVVHTGKDDEVFAFSATAPNIAGHEWLRHLGPANTSYLAPVGKGLTLQGGIFGSVIGYDSLYAKDNVNYTRPWGADFTPYLMLGINASYPFTDALTATFFVINGYWHLAHANDVPSVGVQFAYTARDRLTFKQTALWGPHQPNTSLGFWRLLSDTIIEHRTDRVTMAAEYHVATEQVDGPGRPRAWWMAAQVPVRWNIRGPVSMAIRPEVAWDSTGRWTLAEQTVKAVTSTFEYRLPYRWTNAMLRLEHRFDDSRGPGGGFFTAARTTPSAVALKPSQHLIVLAAVLTVDSPAR